jgi:aquaporin Z
MLIYTAEPMPALTFRITALSPNASPLDAIRVHWKEYLMEAAELAMLMLCICCAGALFYSGKSPMVNLGLPWSGRAAMMGLSVAGATFVIIKSPLGRRTGAHFNPALTLAYFSLRRVHHWDALGYIMAQFIGGAAGVFVAHQFLGTSLSDFPVRFVVTVPGRNGELFACLAVLITSFTLMGVVLIATSHQKLAKISPIFVALVTMFSYVSSASIAGYSVNPARSYSSALFAHIWWGIWIYFVAPCLGMVVAAYLYQSVAGPDRVYCAKVFHDFRSTCPFNCQLHNLYDQPRR